MASDNLLFTREATAEDEDFRFQVYCSTRQEEVSMWGWDVSQQSAFLQMQFHMQQMSYKQQYPEANYQIIVLGKQPIGHALVVNKEEAFILADLALLLDYRNRGVGSGVIRKLQSEAEQQNKGIKLHVMSTNPACQLYERLGFRTTDKTRLHNKMVWEKVFE